MIHKLIIASYLFSVLFISGCASAPKNEEQVETEQQKVAKALESFKTNPALDTYFEQAKGYIVLPHNFRAGTGFGGAIGHGWLVVDGNIQSKVYHWQFLAGADLGFQIYHQILFLKDEATITEFRGNVFQFAGQANATALLWGKGLTPSYSNGTALFTMIDGGLMLEGSVGLHSYHIMKRE